MGLVIFAMMGFVFSACTPRPFVPVNEGREYGNPKTPWVVSHLPESNQWALARTRHHNVFQKILCFHYPCRKMIGRRKVLKAISFEDFRKRIRKNAKKGVYKKKAPVTPAIRKTKPDSLGITPSRKDTTHIALKATETKTIIPVAPILKADSLITLGEVLFEVNSYKLKPEHLKELDLLGTYLQAHPTLHVSISGHTDNTGNERHNVSLSLRRAESVAEYLIEKGVVESNVFYEGFGSSQPVSDNSSATGRSKNRRVEILIKDPAR